MDLQSATQQQDLADAIRQHHAANDELARGDPEPYKKVYSHRDDVTLANPFGPAVRGWQQVSDMLTYVSTRFQDGEATSFETIAEYVSPDLATVLEVERWRVRMSGRDEASPFVLRVTTTFRREEGIWKLVHRHADPIASAHPDGPLRPMGS